MLLSQNNPVTGTKALSVCLMVGVSGAYRRANSETFVSESDAGMLGFL